MKSLADELPPEIARQIHPDWRKNEAEYWAYWAVRDQLLGQYQGQWVAFADGAVITSGTNPSNVLDAAHESGRHPFFTCVGMENEPAFRMRRSTFLYDVGYPGPALPLISVEFRTGTAAPGMVLDRVTPDTGADGPSREVIVNP